VIVHRLNRIDPFLEAVRGGGTKLPRGNLLQLNKTIWVGMKKCRKFASDRGDQKGIQPLTQLSTKGDKG
jgi:hypothetical protein